MARETASQELPSGLSARERFIDENGRELVDSTPMAPPVGYERRPSMVEIIRAQVREHASRYADDREMDTFEEADDFDVGDDYDPASPWEEQFDPAGFEPGAGKAFKEKVEKERKEKRDAAEKAIIDRHEKSRAASERPKDEAKPESDPEP